MMQVLVEYGKKGETNIHLDRHASVQSNGDLWILNLEDEVTDEYYKDAWKSVTVTV